MFKRDADGIAKKGKTEGRNLGDSGPTNSTKVKAKNVRQRPRCNEENWA
jgi:hypothetical protein